MHILLDFPIREVAYKRQKGEGFLKTSSLHMPPSIANLRKNASMASDKCASQEIMVHVAPTNVVEN